MTKKPAVLSVFILLLVMSTACYGQPALVYSGPFVTVNSPLTLCATATDAGGPVSGAGVWFQAWNIAGIPRTNGPMSTVYTNALGRACNKFNVNEGLYVVQAFGTNGFGGVSSLPVVVSNWKTNSPVEATSAGIATYRVGRFGPYCDAAFGILIDLGDIFGVYTSKTTKGQRQTVRVVSQCSGSGIEDFLWLDQCNPAGPTRIQTRNFRTTSTQTNTSGGTGRIQIEVIGTALATVGDTTVQASLRFYLDTGETPVLYPLNANRVCLSNGIFELEVYRLNGQPIYDISGTFRGTTCTFFDL